MPQATQTVTMLLGLIILNAGLVLWSVVDHHAPADPQQSSAPKSNPSSHQQLLDLVPHPTPDQLPTADPPENLQADAGFQQFLEQAAAVLPELANSDLLRASSTAEETTQSVATEQPSSELRRTRPAYESIEARLELVSQLNQASLGLTREASQSASAGDLPRAEKLMADVTYLRKLAADLLLDR